MSKACSLSLRKAYGLQCVCQVWEINHSTVYAQRHQRALDLKPTAGLPTRRGPKGLCSDEVLVGHIRRVLAASPFHGEGHRQQVAVGLAVRHDHRPAYMADDFQRELKFLGIQSSPSFVREPQGNGCAERFIRLLKENLLWVRTFATIEELRLALLAFKEQYNTRWILQRHGYRTPSQVRNDLKESRISEVAG